MAVLSPSTIFAPGRKPPKSEIIQFLDMIQGTGSNPAVVKQTKAALDLVTPASENYGGLVLNDSDATKNGYYYRSSSTWVKGRGFPDTFAVLTSIGGTANAITASTEAGVNPADILCVLLPDPPGTNSSTTVTLTLNGGSPESVKAASGANLAIGDIIEGVGTLFFKVGSEWRQLFSSATGATFDHQGTFAAPTTYTEGQVVTGSDGNWYQLKVPSAQGDDPVGSVTGNWLPILIGAVIADNSIAEPKYGTGSVSTRALADEAVEWSKLGDDVVPVIGISPLAFGGIGDGDGEGGGTDDTDAVQDALDFAGANAVNLLGRTWRVDGQLTLPSGKKVFNGTLDFTNRPDSSYAMTTAGVDGTGISASAISAGANTITVANGAAFAAGRWIFIKSADVFDFASSTKGEWQRVKSIAGNVLTLYSLVRDSYSTTVTVYQPTLKAGIVLDDLVVIGGGDGHDQKAALLTHVYGLQVRGCTFRKFHNRCLDIRRSIHHKIMGNHFEDGDGTTGNSYGVCAVNGNEGGVISGNSGDNLRHLVTLGGEDGIDWGSVVVGNTGNNMSDSGIDCHPGCWDFVFANNTVNSLHPSVDADENRHGMTIQGARGVVSGNKIRGFKGIGIHYQPLTKEAYDSMLIIGNNVQGTEAGSIGIYVDSQKTAGTLEQVAVNDNIVRVQGAASQGIVVEVQNTASGNLSGLCLEGNNVQAQSSALLLRTAALKFLSDVIVTGRYRSDGTADPVITLYAGSTTTYMTAISIRAVIRGGSYGIRNVSDYVGKLLVDGCVIQGFASAATLGAMTLGDNITT